MKLAWFLHNLWIVGWPNGSIMGGLVIIIRDSQYHTEKGKDKYYFKSLLWQTLQCYKEPPLKDFVSDTTTTPPQIYKHWSRFLGGLSVTVLWLIFLFPLVWFNDYISTVCKGSTLYKITFIEWVIIHILMLWTTSFFVSYNFLWDCFLLCCQIKNNFN